MASLQAWRQVRFNREGVQDVRRHFGIAPTTYQQFSKRFAASELAWFVGGASDDGQHSQLRCVLRNHNINSYVIRLSDGFHPLFTELHKGNFDKEMQHALMRLLFDVVSYLFISLNLMVLTS